MSYPKILIVEDDELSYILLKEHFTKNKISYIRVKKGIDAIKHCQEDMNIGLVLMDIMLPDMSGLEATRQIKQHRKDLVVIAQTAAFFDETASNCLSAGCTELITKPIIFSTLTKTIAKYFKMN